MSADSSELDPERAVGLLARLHEVKNAGYGDAWRKRGELFSIFTNLARKYDRLVVALDQGRVSADERPIDTAADLCVYACKYLTWLADEHAEGFEAASPLRADTCADDSGDAPLTRVLEAIEIDEGLDWITAWGELKRDFDLLDQGLVTQAEGTATLDWRRKAELAWRIASESAALLLALARARPEEAREWRVEIEAIA